MVQMLVKINDDSQCLKEWTIIEVQGELECSTKESIAGKLIGHLFFSSKKRPFLIIGHQTLYGKVVESNPPLAVLKRTRLPNAVSPPTVSYGNHHLQSQYELLAFVKKKITFKTRPKPVV